MAEYLEMGEIGLTEVWNGLWVGQSYSITPEVLAKRNIRKVVVANPDHGIPKLPEGIELIETILDDSPQEDISKHFPTVVRAFIVCQAAEVGLACVCAAGVSRSASLALAAMVGGLEGIEDISLRGAYNMIKQKRPFIRPNNGFFEQLIEYEKRVLGTASVTMVVDPRGKSVPDIYLEEIGKSNMFPHFVSL